jgi:uncharacterized protein
MGSDHKLWVLLAVAVAVWGGLCLLARRSAFFPARYPQGRWTEQSRLGAQDVWLQADGNRLHAWWVEVPGATTATLFLHGNAGNLSHRGYAVEAVTAAGSSILVLDYRGYGKSEGSPSEAGLYADAQAAYDWLRGKGFARLVVHGESLGAAVAVDLASRNKVEGLILEAPFSSGRDMAAAVLPGVGPLVFWGWNSAAKITKVQAPLLLLHGDHDEVVPFRLGQRLFEAAKQPKTFWRAEGAGHNDLALHPGYRRTLEAYFSSIR